MITGLLAAGIVAVAGCSSSKASTSANSEPGPVIDIPGHGRLTSLFSDTRAERGEHVGLRLDPRGYHLFSAGPGEAAQPVSAGLDPVTAGP
jgi:hypothetical protein